MQCYRVTSNEERENTKRRNDPCCKQAHPNPLMVHPRITTPLPSLVRNRPHPHSNRHRTYLHTQDKRQNTLYTTQTSSHRLSFLSPTLQPPNPLSVYNTPLPPRLNFQSTLATIPTSVFGITFSFGGARFHPKPRPPLFNRAQKIQAQSIKLPNLFIQKRNPLPPAKSTQY